MLNFATRYTGCPKSPARGYNNFFFLIFYDLDFRIKHDTAYFVLLVSLQETSFKKFQLSSQSYRYCLTNSELHVLTVNQ